MSALTSLTKNMAERFQLESADAKDLMTTLQMTAFKGEVTQAQMTALMLVAQQYGLNPWTKEIYAFPDKNNGIIPVVGVDGWARIINENPQFDGMDFEQTDESCTCTIYRKDRAHPIKVTEWMSECRGNGRPWQSHPKRMLRHKTLIQCARLAFGFVGIYDQDEAERIVDYQDTRPVYNNEPEPEKVPEVIEYYSSERFKKNEKAWRELILTSKKTAQEIIDTVNSNSVLTAEQEKEIKSWEQE